MQDYFRDLAGAIASLMRGEEIYTASFHAEESDFVRLNRSRIRQAGHVRQLRLQVDLIEGRRHAWQSLGLTGDLATDAARLRSAVAALREIRAVVDDDPFLLYATEVRSSEHVRENHLPDADAVLAAVDRAGKGRDLVGLYASGGSCAGFANSFGQRNWHETYSYNLDWSFHAAADRAVKQSYAGFDWDPAELEGRVSFAVEQLSSLARPPHAIRPGRYRVYHAPAALEDVLWMLSFGGFGARAHRTKTTPLLRMVEEGRRLHASLSLAENTKEGVAPDFQDAGFPRPDCVSLIRAGSFGEHLVSPRSAAEYRIPTNGASAAEMPLSLDLEAGSLARDGVLRELGTGIFVGNLHYLNFSDRSACRTTGMTRYATFWVENGHIAAPLAPMRFDETLYRMLGENLVALTREREVLLDPLSYGARSSRSARLPGALIDDFTLTL